MSNSFWYSYLAFFYISPKDFYKRLILICLIHTYYVVAVGASIQPVTKPPEGMLYPHQINVTLNEENNHTKNHDLVHKEHDLHGNLNLKGKKNRDALFNKNTSSLHHHTKRMPSDNQNKSNQEKVSISNHPQRQAMINNNDKEEFRNAKINGNDDQGRINKDKSLNHHFKHLRNKLLDSENQRRSLLYAVILVSIVAIITSIVIRHRYDLHKIETNEFWKTFAGVAFQQMTIIWFCTTTVWLCSKIIILKDNKYDSNKYLISFIMIENILMSMGLWYSIHFIVLCGTLWFMMKQIVKFHYTMVNSENSSEPIQIWKNLKEKYDKYGEEFYQLLDEIDGNLLKGYEQYWSTYVQVSILLMATYITKVTVSTTVIIGILSMAAIYVDGEYFVNLIAISIAVIQFGIFFIILLLEKFLSKEEVDQFWENPIYIKLIQRSMNATVVISIWYISVWFCHFNKSYIPLICWWLQQIMLCDIIFPLAMVSSMGKMFQKDIVEKIIRDQHQRIHNCMNTALMHLKLLAATFVIRIGGQSAKDKLRIQARDSFTRDNERYLQIKSSLELGGNIYIEDLDQFFMSIGFKDPTLVAENAFDTFRSSSADILREDDFLAILYLVDKVTSLPLDSEIAMIYFESELKINRDGNLSRENIHYIFESLGVIGEDRYNEDTVLSPNRHSITVEEFIKQLAENEHESMYDV